MPGLRLQLRLRLIGAFLRERPSHFLLAVVLAALGMASATAVLWLRDTLEAHAARQAEGIDIVVGAKGSALQNVLAAVYHVDVANGNIPLAEVEAIAARADVARAVPIALGDSVGGARIVGTTPEFLSLYGAQGQAGSTTLAPMEALLGAEVARRTGLRVGDHFVGTHGLAEGGEEHDSHPYRVTGILAPTGRVIDQLVVTALESVWLVHEGHTAATEPEVTFALVTVKGPAAMAILPRALNARPALQAAVPALESARLLTVFGWVVTLVQAFAWTLVAAALASLFGALMQAAARREPDFAMLSAIGARPVQLALLLLVELVVVVFYAAVIALLIVLALPSLVSALVGVTLPWRVITGVGWLSLVLAVTALIALLAGVPPVIRAGRVDVARQLTDR